MSAAAAVILLRRHRRASPSARRPWRCECGQSYLVHGTDRHRVYWLPGAADSDPVLGHECVQCGSTLPAEHGTALAPS